MRSFTYLRVFGALGQVGEIGPKYPNQRERYTEGDPNYSTRYLKSNDA